MVNKLVCPKCSCNTQTYHTKLKVILPKSVDWCSNCNTIWLTVHEELSVNELNHVFYRGELDIHKKFSKAIRLACTAHFGQLRKDGKLPYIMHPLDVAERCKTMNEKIVAVLHDVVEDSDVTLYYIKTQFGDQIANAVDSVTRRNNESYIEFCERAAKNPIGRWVKIHDINCNMRNIDEIKNGESLKKRYQEGLPLLLYPKPDYAVEQIWRSSGLCEDICEHGVGHPNREWLKLHPKREGYGLHGCDGCCSRKEICKECNGQGECKCQVE